jgi:hypothetical protein
MLSNVVMTIGSNRLVELVGFCQSNPTIRRSKGSVF